MQWQTNWNPDDLKPGLKLIQLVKNTITNVPSPHPGVIIKLIKHYPKPNDPHLWEAVLVEANVYYPTMGLYNFSRDDTRGYWAIEVSDQIDTCDPTCDCGAIKANTTHSTWCSSINES